MEGRVFTGRNVLTASGIERDMSVAVEGGIITGVSRGGGGGTSAEWIVPGYIDMHIHGGMRFSVHDQSPEALADWLEGLMRAGVTAVLPSVHTAPVEVMRRSVQMLGEAMDRQRRGELFGARIAGIHLEGPFISLKRLGAMRADQVLEPTVENFREIAGERAGDIRLVTLAPEVEGCEALIEYLLAGGIRVQAGHTDATYEQALRAFDIGVGAICHFYNGIRGIHHREPGILTAAMLDDSIYCELISDFVHVHPAAARLLIKAKGAGRVMLISDAVKYTGLPDGEYEENGYINVIKNGASMSKDGGLNGGGCYLSGSVKRIISAGIPAGDAFYMAANSGREFIGEERITMRPRSVADFIGLDENLDPVWAYSSGRLAEF